MPHVCSSGRRLARRYRWELGCLVKATEGFVADSCMYALSFSKCDDTTNVHL